MIYNRFDLFCEDKDYEIVEITSDGQSKYVEYRLNGTTAELGLWLAPLTQQEVDSLVEYVKANHPQIRKITCRNSLVPFGTAKQQNHFRIVFPQTAQEVMATISSKSRSKMNKKLRHAEEEYGKMEILEYKGADIPHWLVQAFFDFKKESYGREYNMTEAEYLNRYHVSHCYAVMFGETVGAIRFCCQQCPVVYGENHAYNPQLRDYSLGRFIFMHSMVRAVEEGHTELYFAGGDFEYKQHYGSVEETVYDCQLAVPAPKPKPAPKPAPKADTSLKGRAKAFAKKHLPAPLFNALKKVKNAIKG